ncbi:S1 family peptidase [Streptomyces profundus]|uniref:S1 family peptidase n=1 Tax=Streptomyces profundus TaxID=2867410 RepID=UPI001D168D6D|nr:S1 family peptidase [Streptomyces sp. MA3_2.13]UED87244.1 S1 family peptidase [Streptomyces sp. MA3_2.13]
MSTEHPRHAPLLARPPRLVAALSALAVLVSLLTLSAAGAATAAGTASAPSNAVPATPGTAFDAGATAVDTGATAFDADTTAADAGATAEGAQPLLAGGTQVYSSTGHTCTLAVNLRISGSAFGLLPGACTDTYPDWYADPQRTIRLGPTVDSQFTHGIFAYQNATIPAEQTRVCGGGDIIDSVGYPALGQTVTTGSTATGCRSGTISAVNVTVDFGNGWVISGLIRTNLCSEPYDFGSGLTAGTMLIGIPVGGSGNCSVGGTTFYQPMAPVLAQYGATII